MYVSKFIIWMCWYVHKISELLMLSMSSMCVSVTYVGVCDLCVQKCLLCAWVHCLCFWMCFLCVQAHHYVCYHVTYFDHLCTLIICISITKEPFRSYINTKSILLISKHCFTTISQKIEGVKNTSSLLCCVTFILA